MTIVPLSPDELRDAFDHDAPGVAAESWRLLRADVRALAPPLDREFERRLGERLREQGRANAAPTPGGPRASARRDRIAADVPWATRLRTRLAGRPLAAGLAAALSSVLLVALLVGGVFSSGPERIPAAASLKATPKAAAVSEATFSSSAPAVKGDATPAAGTPAPSAPASANGRVQQQGASITLAASASEIQTVADGVSRLASREGGFVANSQVNVQHEGSGSGEATLVLEVPSGRLTATLAALGRLAPVRAQSQSLQDITNSYEQARRAVSDAVAERAALLRALGRASTQAEIESLHRRLALAGAAIERTQGALRAVTHRASNSRLEVAVLASAHAPGSSGLTLSRGIHDVGRVLTVALIVLLIGLAVLIPLGLVLVALLFGARAWRRSQRERALDHA